MISLAKVQTVKWAAGMALWTSLALGVAGCSSGQKNSRMLNGNPYAGLYGQQGQLLNGRPVSTNQFGLPGGKGSSGLGENGESGRSRLGGRGGEKGGKGSKEGDKEKKKEELSAAYVKGYEAAKNRTEMPTDTEGLLGYRDYLKEQVSQKNDPANQQLVNQIEQLENLLALDIPTKKKVPDWKADCASLSPTSTAKDGIPDDCKEQLRLSKDHFYGYRVAAKAIEKEELKSWLKGRETGWERFTEGLGSLFNGKNHGQFNRRLAHVIDHSGGDISQSSLSIVREVAGLGEKSLFADQIRCASKRDPQKATKRTGNIDKCEDKEAWIKGGYSEPVLFNPTGSWSEDFKAAMLTGIGSNTKTLKRDDRFMYVVEGYLDLKEDRDFALASLKGTLEARRAGAFFVFIDDDLSVTNIGLGKDLTKLNTNVPALSEGDCPHRLTIAVIFEESSEGEKPIRENLVLQSLKDDNVWELLPQEISTIKPPKACEGKYSESIIDKISGKLETSPSNTAQ